MTCIQNMPLITMVSIVVAIWAMICYIIQRVEISRYWKIANPSLSKHDIRKILKSLLELERTKYFKEEMDKLVAELDIANLKNEEFEERVLISIKQIVEGYQNVLQFINKLYRISEANNYTKLVDYLNNNTRELDEVVSPIDTCLRSWPEFVSRSERKENDESSTEV